MKNKPMCKSRINSFSLFKLTMMLLIPVLPWFGVNAQNNNRLNSKATNVTSSDTLSKEKAVGANSKATSKRIKITGVITDEKNESVIGATVLADGTTTGTVTDVNGNFTLELAENARIKVSYIGYEPSIISVNGKSFFKIALKPSLQNLEEIVVVGYGVQKKTSSVGSITTAKGDDLRKAGNVSTVSEAMQGLMPGVVAINTDSKPGSDDAEILIRGKASWVSSAPLTMVDGVERSMNDVDPNEIESLSVLKDASATAVFGAKGANGVILITTKRGSNAKPSITFSSNFGIKQPTTSPKYADYVTSMKMYNEAAANDLKWEKIIPESTIAAWENAYATGNYGPNNQYFPEINWWNEMVNNYGTQQQYNINITGGTDFMRYFSSIGYLNDGDIFKTKKTSLYDPSFNYQRYNWRTNFDFQLTESTVLSFNLSGNQGYRNQPGYRIDGNAISDDNSNGQPQFFSSLYSAPSHQFPIYWPDGSYGVSYNGGGNLALNFDRGQRVYKTYQNFIDVSLKQNLDLVTKGLAFSTKFSYNTSSQTHSDIQRQSGVTFGEQNYIGFYKQYDYSQPLADGGYAVSKSSRWFNDQFQGVRPSASYNQLLNGGLDKRLYYEAAFNYNRSFGNSNITALTMFNRNEVDGLQSGSTVSLKFTDRDEAWVSRVTYNWKEKYLVEFNGAYQGSQKFDRGKRFAFFPSYSIGWRISEEPIVKRIAGKSLDNLKVRFSSGEVGYTQSAPAFGYIQIYNNAGGSVGFGETAKSNYGPLYTEGSAANPNATWETAVKQNLGFDLSLFSKLTATLDLYQENRTGILMQIKTPIWSGIGDATGNVGITKSHGFEFELGWNDKIGKDFTYWVKGNFSANENRVVFRNDASNTSDYLKQAGKPIGVQNVLQVVGYYNSLDDIYNYSTANNLSTQNKLVPGDFMYLDYNSDGVIDNTYDKIASKHNTFVQTSFGATFGFKYKAFQVNANVYGTSDIFKNVDGSMLWDLADGNNLNYYANPNVVDRWTIDNKENAVKPALHSDNRGYSMVGGTSYSFQDASYIRLKSLELSYELNKSFLKKVGVKSMQVYLNGNNLFTFTNFNKQLDPEGNSVSLYPMVKRYNIGTRISF